MELFFRPLVFDTKECPNRARNIINEKFMEFYTTNMIQFFFRSDYYYFRHRKKVSRFFFGLRLKSHKGIPYTHRWESENNTFQNTLRIFTGLENAFAGPGWTWKYHKSKDQKILHQNYIQKKSQHREFFSCSIKKCFDFFFDFFWSEKKLSEKSEKVEISKI